MKYDAFGKAMGKIVDEAEQLQRQEAAAEQRRARFAKIRKVCLTIIGIGLVAFAFVRRQELGQQLQKLTNAATAPSPSASASANDQLGENLKEIRTAANKRDNALEELTKK